MQGEKQSCSFFLSVFFLFLLFDLAIFINIGSFLLSSFSFVFLVFSLKSFFGRLIDIFPHLTNDFSQFGDFGRWVFWLNLVVNFLSEEEKCWEGSFGGSRLRLIKMYFIIILLFTHYIVIFQYKEVCIFL